MQDEENVYSLEKLWGLGPIKKESPVQNPQDVVKFDRYKVITKICDQYIIDTMYLVVWRIWRET